MHRPYFFTTFAALFDFTMQRVTPKYHIFLSYRREDKHIARMLKESLARKGYRVFLDLDELQDGVFDERILTAIDTAPIYMLIMTEHSFDRCANPQDWVRQEIEYAIAKGKTIIPININNQFQHYPADMPAHLQQALSMHQYSAIDTGQLYQESVDKLLRERVKPTLTPPFRSRICRWIGWVLLIASVLVAVRYTWTQAIPEYYISLGDSCMEPDTNYNIDYYGALAHYQRALKYGYVGAYAKCGEAYKGLKVMNERPTNFDWVAYEDTAVQYFRQGAYAGDAYAQVLLAQSLASQGFSTWTNHDSAVYWAMQAYNAGHAKAPGVLGYLYRKGFGVKEDAKMAEQYFREGVEMGDNYSRSSLGDMLRHGQGIDKNYVEGTRYLVESMKKEDFAAMLLLNDLNTWVDKPYVDESTESSVTLEAFEWDDDGVLRVYLHWHNKMYPNGWMQIDSSAYIRDRATGVHYPIVGLINCKFSPAKTSVPLGTTHQFGLIFGEVPQTIQEVDLCESDTSQWKFFGIHLDEKTHIMSTTEYLLQDLQDLL